MTRLIQEINNDTAVLLQENDIQPISIDGYKAYLETGNRLMFESEYFNRRRQLVTLALHVVIDSDPKETIALLEQVIWEVCNEYSWALPAHLEKDSDSTFSTNSPSMIDLFAAETAQTLSEIREILEYHLSKFIIERIEYEIEKRILTPFESRPWTWERLDNNWSSVIASCIGMTSLSLMDKDSPRLHAILDRLDQSFYAYFSSFSDDGVCEEGISYWTYGFGYYCYFAEKYQSIFNDDKYTKNPLLTNIAAFPFAVQISEKQFIPFSDSQMTTLPIGLLSFCQNTFQVNVPYPNEAPSLHFDHCYRWAHLYRNLLWAGEIKNQVANKIHYFPDAEWLLVNDKENQLLFAAKGGNNNESHNHNDVGHFIIGTQDELFLTDLGAGEYTQAYFHNETRYTFLNNRSLGHSVPFINYTEQRAGRFAAKKTQFQDNENGWLFSMELDDVYSENAFINRFCRQWHWDYLNDALILTDEIEFSRKKGNSIIQNFVSRIEPVVKNDVIFWKGADKQLELHFKNEGEQIVVIPEVIQAHDGKNQEVFRLILVLSDVKRDYRKDLYFKLRNF